MDIKLVPAFVLDRPNDDIMIKGIHTKIKQVRLIGTNETLANKKVGGAKWLNIPGVLQVTLSADKCDKNVSVIAIDLEAPLELYRGTGGAIDRN